MNQRSRTNTSKVEDTEKSFDRPDLVLTLSVVHYIFIYYIGDANETIHPFQVVVDTGSGYKVIHHIDIHEKWRH